MPRDHEGEIDNHFIAVNQGDLPEGVVERAKGGMTERGGQALLAVGYDDRWLRSSRGAILVRSSWGTGWGQQGYGWLPYAFIEEQLAVDIPAGARRVELVRAIQNKRSGAVELDLLEVRRDHLDGRIVCRGNGFLGRQVVRHRLQNLTGVIARRRSRR